MNAADALRVAKAAGIEVAVEEGYLALRASAQPPTDIIDLLANNKADIMALLRSRDDRLPAELPEEPIKKLAQALEASTVRINSLINTLRKPAE